MDPKYENIILMLGSSENPVFQKLAKEFHIELLIGELQTEVLPIFQRNLEKKHTSLNESHKQMTDNIKYLSEHVERIIAVTTELKADVKTERIVRLIKAYLLQHLSEYLTNSFCEYFCSVFKIHENMSKDAAFDINDSGDDITNECLQCGQDIDQCTCLVIFDGFINNCEMLKKLDIYAVLCGIAIDRSLELCIEQHVKEVCQGTFEVSYLAHLENWILNVAVVWLKIVSPVNVENEYELSKITEKLKNKVSHVFVSERKNQLFNIIIDYPESQPALEDLCFWLKKTNSYSEVMEALTESLQTRLLHPGVNTTDILTAYVSTMKSLNILDPSVAMLEAICIPVRNYLKRREDTIRCIVTSLTDDSAGDLAEELTRSAPLTHAHLEEGAEQDYELWEPDPAHARREGELQSVKKGDIITTLVSIYGGKDLFVKEYQNLLCLRLLSQTDPNLDREIKYLELLKLRFGESQLHSCEVMLQDVVNSKRMNTILVDLLKERGCSMKLESIVISAQYWPQTKDEVKVILPAGMEHYLCDYEMAYNQLKVNRALTWKTNLGHMKVLLELGNKSIEITTSQINVAVLWSFQEQESWKIDCLARFLGMTVSHLRQRIAFWVKQGILKEDSIAVYLADDITPTSHVNNKIVDIESEEEDMTSEATKKESCMDGYWNYIHGMLTNLDTLSAERIHHMLSMFAVPNGNEFTIEDVVGFLESQVKAGALVYTTGSYRLSKQ
ncbi:anaphase-promoting complex subunit 2-like [Artemia franciscana]|uniref:Anaphase-promoting complex subunit 2 n=1 Tax=Artemia franciscana TaxID=6661 RepID=A0AA88I221_ARTSF|nr:hypothetical protein QYM36_004147 [Artemia franciscana]